MFFVRNTSFTVMESSSMLPNNMAHDSFGEFTFEWPDKISIWFLDKIIALGVIILL